jgi:eukaryotic-like serine/threonine-protein kinase
MSADERPAVPSKPPTRVVLREPGAAPAAPVVAPASGRAGRYELLGEIARGGMGLVLKGRDAELGRDVALKMLRVEHAANESVLQRFVEEAQIGGQLQHPGIVPVYELGKDASGSPYFTMKLVKGRTLSSPPTAAASSRSSSRPARRSPTPTAAASSIAT